MTAARKRTPSISNKERKKHSETSSVLPTPRKRLVFIWSFVAVTIGVLIAKHPKASSFASDFLPPADKLLADLENWGNFTVSSRIRQAVLEMFDSSLLTSQADVPFYIDIISDSNSTIKRPTVFIPGYITSGLEIWESLPCAKTKFRERIWGTASMVKLLITDSKCWVQHMLLSPVRSSDSKTVHYTDPPGVRIRASTGLGAADYVIGDYWVWGPIIESLGSADYDETRMSMMSYDWRYALRDLEHRTKYFSRLKHEIEKLYAINNKEPVLIITHSFGSKVWFFFMQWVSHHFHPDWIDTHVAVVYNIAPVLLGLPKAISALLSGDTRDTAQMGALSSLVDALIPPSDRVALTSSWGSIFDMLPAGGSRVWKHPMMFLEINNTVPIGLSAEESINLLMKTDSMSAHALHQNSSQRGQLRCPPTESLSDCYMDEWTDPLISPLPRISRMKMVLGSPPKSATIIHYPPRIPTTLVTRSTRLILVEIRLSMGSD
jgi:hypothetical protein